MLLLYNLTLYYIIKCCAILYCREYIAVFLYSALSLLSYTTLHCTTMPYYTVRCCILYFVFYYIKYTIHYTFHYDIYGVNYNILCSTLHTTLDSALLYCPPLDCSILPFNIQYYSAPYTIIPYDTMAYTPKLYAFSSLVLCSLERLCINRFPICGFLA